MKLVVIESPFAGEVLRNIAYAKRCMRDSLARNEAGFASHLLYAQEGILDDTEPSQRKLGIEAGFAWGRKADLIAFYVDLGWSPGMQLGFERAWRRTKIELRTLDRSLKSTDYAVPFELLAKNSCAKRL